jgi:5-methylcytosine-specific restriction endonuclease McrA
LKKKKTKVKKNKKTIKSTKKSSDYENSYLKQPLWLETIRPRVVKRDDNKCQVCGCSKNLQVHHRSYAKKVMRGEDDSQLITLCRKHHIEIEFIEYHKKNDAKNKKRLRSDVDKKLNELLAKAYENKDFLP